MRTEYDVIIAGAGPGGSTTAYELARRGVRVGVFEKQHFPRSKPCGGCLSLKIDRILDPGFHALIERTIHGVRFTLEGLRPAHRRSDRPVAYMVTRERFDTFLRDQARQAGAEVHEGEAVRVIREQEDSVEVETTRGSYRSRFLVGADGATGIVARELGLKPGKRIAVASASTSAPCASSPPRAMSSGRHLSMRRKPGGVYFLYRNIRNMNNRRHLS